MKRIATILVALVASVALAAPAQASKRASWIQPPTNLETFGNIYGGNHDGYVADHINAYGDAVNTMYPRRHAILFEYCPRVTSNDRDAFVCQAAWAGFYAFLRENRVGTWQDWIEQQYPHGK